MTILVTVVVSTFRRPQLLEQCLEALFTQNFPPHAYEVIIVDDDPQTGEARFLVAEWQQRLNENLSFLNFQKTSEVWSVVTVSGRLVDLAIEPIHQIIQVSATAPRLKYIPAHHTQGPAAARNIGWRAAAGQIIAFTDDDCIPKPDWLANGVSAFVEGVVGVSGRILVPLPPDPTDNDLNATGLERSEFITANCFYRRSILQEVGGFDERFAAAWREDSDLFFTIRKHNYALAWAAGAIVLHPVRKEAWGASLRQQRKAFYNALLYKKHPDLYWRYIQPAPPWQYYLILFGFSLAAAGLLFGQPFMAAAGFAFWAALTVRFIIKRLEHTSRAPGHILEIVLTSLIIPILAIYWRLRGTLHWRVLFL